MFLEGTNRVVGGRQRKVVEFYRTIAACGDYEGIVSFRPANVVNAVSGVVSGDFRYGSVWSELKNVNSAVTKDAEILCGGDGDFVFVKGAEFDGVTVKGGSEYRHLSRWLVVLVVGGLTLWFLDVTLSARE